MTKKEAKELLKKDKIESKAKKDKVKLKELYDNKEWYTIRAILGNQ